MRCFVLSQPKAGTYLCANLLEEFGLTNTCLHISDHDYQKYDLTDLTKCRENTGSFTHKKEFSKSLQMIKSNEFAVGHIRSGHKPIKALSKFKKIFLVRDAKEIQQSAERWKELSGRNVNEKSLLHVAEEMLPWENEEDVFVLPFRKMINKDRIYLDQLQIYLFGEIRVDSVRAMRAALERDSLTKSQIRK